MEIIYKKKKKTTFLVVDFKSNGIQNDPHPEKNAPFDKPFVMKVSCIKCSDINKAFPLHGLQPRISLVMGDPLDLSLDFNLLKRSNEC